MRAMDRKTALELTTFGSAVLVGAVASASSPIAVFGTALGGVAGGIFANELGALNNSLKDTDLRNAHLTRAVGVAIAVVIRTVAAEWKQKRRANDRVLTGLETIAQTAITDWAAIVQNTLKDRVPAGLDEKELAATYFSEVTTNFNNLRALATWEDWLPVLEELRSSAQNPLKRSLLRDVKLVIQNGAANSVEEKYLNALAKRLHQLFPRAIREVLKQDFSQGKESFAAMIFDLLGNLTQEVQQLRQQSGLSGGDVAKLDQALEQLAEFKGRNRQQLQILAGRMDSGFDRVLEALNLQQVQIQDLLANSFESVLSAIARDGEQTRTVIKDETGKLGEQLSGVETRILDAFQQPKPALPLVIPSNLKRYERKINKFVGREVAMGELEQLMAETTPGGIVAVSGMGGLGKTELAWQWAQQQYDRGNFPGGVVWLDVAAGNPGEQLLLFCQTEFSVEIPQELPTLEERVAFCWQHWAEWRSGAVLVVFDDVVRDRDARTIQNLQPGGSNFRILWTTRDRWSGVQPYALDHLSTTAAKELLASYISPERLTADPAALTDLLAWFEGLPLGLELAGRYLALESRLSLKDYVGELNLSHESLDQNLEMKYPHGIEAALALSWHRLPPESAARELALRLGLFGAGAIPLNLEEQRQPLQKLENLHLIQIFPNSQVGFHPLVRQFVRGRVALELSTEASNNLRQQVAQLIVSQGQQIPQSFTTTQAQEFAPWIPHLEEAANTLLPWVADEDVIQPSGRIALYYQGQGLYGAAEPWSKRCVAVAKERLGDQHPDTASALNNLGNLYESQGKYEAAEPLFLEALEIDRVSLPPNHPNLATVLISLGNLSRSQGKYAEAETLFLEALEIDRASLPLNHPDLAIDLNNLAGLYESQGKYAEAETRFLEALEIDRASLSPNHPSLAINLHNLALLYEAQGKYAAAEPLYLQALEIFYGSLGEDHPNTQTVLSNVTRFYQTALAAGLPDTRLRQHPLGSTILSRL